ncbi:MAG: DUF4129 domain-containing protein [Planctomycetes bacterium]|nr:DUF4129 domain-containing protein [Planctomycetota bacterium]
MEIEPKLKPNSLDYAFAAFSPGLIILMIGSLVCFLLCILYQGEFPARLMWILGLFTFASVLISRIAIEQSRAQSLVYLGLLGGATLLVAPRFFVVDGPMAPFSLPVLIALLSLIAYLADRITMDATSVDEARESNGEGLLQSLGLLKRANTNTNAKQGIRQHNPGVWILYFALLAIPVFGLGQLFIQAAPTRKLAFVCMIAYLFSALSLLVVISLLSLRKYVRQRGVEMEGTLSAKWLAAGISATLGLIILMAILPFPMLSSNIMELPFRITSRTDLASSRWGWGNEGAGNSGQQGDSMKHPVVQQKQAANQPNANQPNASQPNANQARQQAQSANGQETPSQPGNGNATSNSKDNSSSGSGATGPGSSNLTKDGSSSGQKPSGANSSGTESANSRTPSSTSDPQKNGSGGDESQNKSRSSSDKPSSNLDTSNSPSNNRNNTADKNTGKKLREPNETEQNETEPSGRNNGSKQENQPNNRDNAQPQPVPPRPDQNRNRDPQNAPQDPSPSNGFSMEWNLAAAFRWLVLAGLFLVTLIYGILYQRQILTAIRDFFHHWFGWFSGESDEETEPDTLSPSETTVPQILFSSFSDPFQESPSDPNKIVRRLFAAIIAWASEHRVRRREEETPEEFLRRLGRKYSEIQEPLLQLGMLYSRLAYAQKSVPMNEARSLRPMWAWLVAHAPQSSYIPTPQSEAAILLDDRR